jgi:Na+-transporting methylmalonyl-CoA/oxaloacetate decarboxylase gamma subunit
MSFSWGEACKVALIGFTAVFVILVILQLGVNLVSLVARKLTREPKQQVKEKTALEK